MQTRGMASDKTCERFWLPGVHLGQASSTSSPPGHGSSCVRLSGRWSCVYPWPRFRLCKWPARGSTPPRSIAQAERLIAANSHAAAVVLLEDLLADVEPKKRPAILELLKKSYDVLAREAKAAGRDREAAHYRDNLAIIEQSRDATTPASPPGATSGSPAGPAPTTDPIKNAKGSVAPEEPPQSLHDPLSGSVERSVRPAPAAAVPALEPPNRPIADRVPSPPRPLDTFSSRLSGPATGPSAPRCAQDSAGRRWSRPYPSGADTIGTRRLT